jgi:zinc transport system ATP-binding protein
VHNSLIVKHNDNVVFTSDAHWLHPLFEFHEFLSRGDAPPVAEMILHDKVAGRAAACMIVYLGIRKCHIELMSSRAIPVFKRAGVEFTYDNLVEQISCMTEVLISDDMPVDDVWLLLRKRASRVDGLPVRLENVCVSVDSRPLLCDLNLDLSAGEQLVIYGSNGVGKTTLLKAILGLVRPESGIIRVGDYVVGSAEWRRNRVNTAYVCQENTKNVFPISAREVASVGLAGSKMSRQEMAYNVEIAMRRTGCFNLAKQSYHLLSGGEKQRVSLARCLCQKAKVLLLDEPTSFLDQSGKDDLLVLLRELCRNEAPTVLIVSHDPVWSESLAWERRELKGGCLC